jgi:hypothetical protein
MRRLICSSFVVGMLMSLVGCCWHGICDCHPDLYCPTRQPWVHCDHGGGGGCGPGGCGGQSGGWDHGGASYGGAPYGGAPYGAPYSSYPSNGIPRGNYEMIPAPMDGRSKGLSN